MVLKEARVTIVNLKSCSEVFFVIPKIGFLDVFSLKKPIFWTLLAKMPIFMGYIIKASDSSTLVNMYHMQINNSYRIR